MIILTYCSTDLIKHEAVHRDQTIWNERVKKGGRDETLLSYWAWEEVKCLIVCNSEDWGGSGTCQEVLFPKRFIA